MTKQLVTAQELDAPPNDCCQSSGAARLERLLRRESARIVLAESCTVGRAAVALGAIPGISAYFCGSVVAYRDQSKMELLGVQEVGLKIWTSVSAPIAAQMARNVLRVTTEANYAASITGYLGADGPAGGKAEVFIGLAWREQGEEKLYRVVRASMEEQTRRARQQEATALLLHQLADCIVQTRA